MVSWYIMRKNILRCVCIDQVRTEITGAVEWHGGERTSLDINLIHMN